MSQNAAYHAKLDAESLSTEALAAKIRSLQTVPPHSGVEFDDVRVNHMHQTRISTLREVLASRAPARSEYFEAHAARLIAIRGRAGALRRSFEMIEQAINLGEKNDWTQIAAWVVYLNATEA
jgi:anthranilate phosphoribosyltransferase